MPFRRQLALGIGLVVLLWLAANGLGFRGVLALLNDMAEITAQQPGRGGGL